MFIQKAGQTPCPNGSLIRATIRPYCQLRSDLCVEALGLPVCVAQKCNSLTCPAGHELPDCLCRPGRHSEANSCRFLLAVSPSSAPQIVVPLRRIWSTPIWSIELVAPDHVSAACRLGQCCDWNQQNEQWKQRTRHNRGQSSQGWPHSDRLY